MKELHAVLLPNGSVQLEWSETSAAIGKSTAILQAEVEKRFREDPDGWLLRLGFSDPAVALSPSLGFWRRFSGLFSRALTRTPGLELLRHKAVVPFEKERCAELLEQAPPMTGSEYLTLGRLEDYWEALHRYFRAGVESARGSVEEYLLEMSPRVHLVGRVFFHLVENRKGVEPFAFLATYSTRLGKGGTEKHLPLKYALREYDQDRGKLLELLATVQAASARSELLSGLMESGELFHPLAWSAAEAFAFLREVPIYEESGILCRIPDWWKGSRGTPRLNISVGRTAPAHLGVDSLLGFQASLFLGEEEISLAEARELLGQTEGLVYIKNRWVAVDPEKLRRTMEALERAQGLMDGEGLTLAEAMRLQLAPEKVLGDVGADGVEVELSHGQWLASVVEKMRNPTRAESVAAGKGFRATLRAYQQAGLNWLVFLHDLGFGACLADDMGLGKTIEMLAFLEFLRTSRKAGVSLLVLPASLISNWVDEIKRFAPGLRYLVAHPAHQEDKAVSVPGRKELEGTDLVITTYGLARKTDWLRSIQWHSVILDEAQAIKNPGSIQTRAVKQLRSSNGRIVMTGTPVENSLGDLWSLFDFLNPGLLGTAREFGNFTKTVREDAAGYARLRKLVSPYILRRLKTDKNVISDLPDKVEMKTYAPLSRKQVLLYQQAVADLKDTLSTAEGIRRKGVVLGALMKFKQLCNHPDQYLGSGAYEEKDAGKFGRLREICETIHEKRERVLVFTQFKEITGPLAGFLAEVFGQEGLVIHGGVPVGQRRQIIDTFQGDRYIPFMVLSLKVGGVGLNLTEANHVVHFDRWWNPAVENQATDRVFRIGQKRNVVVHKFITLGTVEEKIDRMLEEKRALVERVVTATGESWITEMEDKELLELFSLKL